MCLEPQILHTNSSQWKRLRSLSFSGFLRSSETWSRPSMASLRSITWNSISTCSYSDMSKAFRRLRFHQFVSCIYFLVWATRFVVGCFLFSVCVCLKVSVFSSDGAVSGPSDGSGEGADNIRRHCGSNRTGAQKVGRSGIKCTGEPASAESSAYSLALHTDEFVTNTHTVLKCVCGSQVCVWVFAGSIRRWWPELRSSSFTDTSCQPVTTTPWLWLCSAATNFATTVIHWMLLWRPNTLVFCRHTSCCFVLDRYAHMSELLYGVTIDCIRSGQRFWVWKIKLMQKCSKPALCWFQRLIVCKLMRKFLFLL